MKSQLAKHGANEASTMGIHGQTIIRLECKPLPHPVAREADLRLVTIIVFYKFRTQRSFLTKKGGLAIQQRAVESPSLTEHCRVFAHSFTTRDTRVEDKSICMPKPTCARG